MIRRIEDFVSAWKSESEGTTKMMRALTDASLSQRITADDRTLGRIAWHIVRSIPEMMSEAKQPIAGFDLEAATPDSAAAIAENYQSVSRALLEMITTSWTDDSLAVTDDMYGEQWKRGFTLQVLIQHEIHHRGQMTVLMRQAGLKVPGIYGPSREEWSNYGMEPPAI
jgi:uncharacterized damage-inducible protein DinB